MDLGTSRRGVDMGPSALRVAGLQSRIKHLGHHVEDIGNIIVKQPEEMPVGEKRSRYVDEIADAADPGPRRAEISRRRLLAAGPWRRPLHRRRIHQRSRRAFPQGKKADRLHLAGCPQRHEHAGKFAIGNVHGMPLAAILGYGVPELHDLFGYKPKIEPQNVVLVGVRDLDSHEKKFIKSWA